MAVESSQRDTEPAAARRPDRGSNPPEAPDDGGATQAAKPSRLPSWLQAWVQRFERSIAGHATQLLRDIVIIDKAMLMAAVSFVSFVPMLIVLAAVFPLDQVHDFSGTLRAAMGLTGSSTKALAGLFAPAGRVAGTTTAGSLAIVIVSGYAFVANLQQTYELIWRRKGTRRVQSFARRWVWLGAFLGFGLGLALLHAWLGDGATAQTAEYTVGFVFSAVFFTWSMHLLLRARVRWAELVPGGVATAVGLVGLRVFSMLVFSPMVVSDADAYGAIGVVFVLMSWLIGACVILVGGPIVGLAFSRRVLHHGDAH